jgi:hypothetical protein
MIRAMRAWVLGLAIGAAVVIGGSGRAQAQGAVTDAAVGFGVGGGLVIGVPALLYTVADIISFAEGTPFAEGWAIAEIVLAGFELAGAITLAAIGGAAADAGTGSEVLILWGLAPLAFGTLHLVHGIWSLASPGEPARAGPLPFVVPRADGAVAGVSGLF